MPVIPQTTRFAPSPTGLLHLGHALAAWWAWHRARESGGEFLLRLEDIDSSRCRPGFTQGILDDLDWLGLAWDGPVVRQSDRLPAYAAALDSLQALGVLYPCFCTRGEIQQEIARMGGAPHGPDGPLYPGTCRHLSPDECAARAATAGSPPALRLDVAAALRLTGPLIWHDRLAGRQSARPESLGDVVLARKDAGTSYHLAVTIDDAWQNITLVTRGHDLLPSTHIHRLLQALLALPVPEWEHHPLVTGVDGMRLAKRDHATTLQTLRAQGSNAARILATARAAAGLS